MSVIEIAPSRVGVIPPDEPKPERPAAARWVRQGSTWYVRVRASMYRQERPILVKSQQGERLLRLGTRIGPYAKDAAWVVCMFWDQSLPDPKPNRGGKRSSEKQANFAELLWRDLGGELWCNAPPVILQRPKGGWAALDSSEISWYIDILKEAHDARGGDQPRRALVPTVPGCDPPF